MASIRGDNCLFRSKLLFCENGVAHSRWRCSHLVRSAAVMAAPASVKCQSAPYSTSIHRAVVILASPKTDGHSLKARLVVMKRAEIVGGSLV